MAFNRDQAEWYNRALNCSDYPAKVMEALDPLLPECRTALDVGAGCGALAIPLAKKLERVSALDPSKPMMDILRRKAEALSMENIEFFEGRWGEVEVEGHDLLLCANVPGVAYDPRRLAGPITAKADKFVALVQGAGNNRDKFYFKEIFPLLYDEQYTMRPDYIKVYKGLHELGICANVRIIEYNLDQPFEDMDEAVAFMRSYLPPFPSEKEKTLRSFLDDKLESADGKLWARMPKKSAVIWWAAK